MRFSRQREVVYQVVRATRCHPDASYVYAQARKAIPNISLGTVYRNLAELCQEGRIKKINIQGDAERYDGFVEPHVHFVCNVCGNLHDLPMDAVTFSHNIDGVTSADIIFYGECENCRKAN